MIRGAATRELSKLGTFDVPQRGRIYDSRLAPYQMAGTLAKQGEYIWDGLEGCLLTCSVYFLSSPPRYDYAWF